jgi:hypothetical protein
MKNESWVRVINLLHEKGYVEDLIDSSEPFELINNFFNCRLMSIEDELNFHYSIYNENGGIGHENENDGEEYEQSRSNHNCSKCKKEVKKGIGVWPPGIDDKSGKNSSSSSNIHENERVQFRKVIFDDMGYIIKVIRRVFTRGEWYIIIDDILSTMDINENLILDKKSDVANMVSSIGFWKNINPFRAVDENGDSVGFHLMPQKHLNELMNHLFDLWYIDIREKGINPTIDDYREAIFRISDLHEEMKSDDWTTYNVR